MGVVILLGAGASVDAGVPLTRDLTQKVVDSATGVGPKATGITRSIDPETAAEMLAFVQRRLQVGTEARPMDIERLIGAVDLLGERSESATVHFVVQWIPELQESAHTPERYRSLSRDLRKVTRSIVNQSITNSVGYLEPLVELAARDGFDGAIATLNYDLTVENCAEDAGFQLSRGVTDACALTELKFQPDHVRLLKLHGSVDWWLRYVQHFSDLLPFERLEVRSGQPDPGSMPALRLGEIGKLTAEGPYLTLLAEFERQLSRASTLVVVGYSFRDMHVNALIRRWCSNEQERPKGQRVIIVDPSFPDPASAFGQEVDSKRNRARDDVAFPPTKIIIIHEFAQAGIEEAVELVELGE